MGFWLGLTLAGGLLIGSLLALLVSPILSGVTVILALMFTLLGFLQRQVASIVYEAWNRVARRFTRVARIVLMGICFYIIFVAVGRTGSSLGLARPTSGRSMWVPRKTLQPIGYPHQYNVSRKELPQRGWIPTFLSWAAQSGNFWAFCLLPFLILLRFLETEEESNFPNNIYSLF
ncbi:MAG TPA: hypothetical protein VGA95_04000 [Thermodesulfobacteriota bacterium]